MVYAARSILDRFCMSCIMSNNIIATEHQLYPHNMLKGKRNAG